MNIDKATSNVVAFVIFTLCAWSFCSLASSIWAGIGPGFWQGVYQGFIADETFIYSWILDGKVAFPFSRNSSTGLKLGFAVGFIPGTITTICVVRWFFRGYRK